MLRIFSKTWHSENMLKIFQLYPLHKIWMSGNWLWRLPWPYHRQFRHCIINSAVVFLTFFFCLLWYLMRIFCRTHTTITVSIASWMINGILTLLLTNIFSFICCIICYSVCFLMWNFSYDQLLLLRCAVSLQHVGDHSSYQLPYFFLAMSFLLLFPPSPYFAIHLYKFVW